MLPSCIHWNMRWPFGRSYCEIVNFDIVKGSKPLCLLTNKDFFFFTFSMVCSTFRLYVYISLNLIYWMKEIWQTDLKEYCRPTLNPLPSSWSRLWLWWNVIDTGLKEWSLPVSSSSVPPLNMSAFLQLNLFCSFWLFYTGMMAHMSMTRLQSGCVIKRHQSVHVHCLILAHVEFFKTDIRNQQHQNPVYTVCHRSRCTSFVTISIIIIIITVIIIFIIIIHTNVNCFYSGLPNDSRPRINLEHCFFLVEFNPVCLKSIFTWSLSRNISQYSFFFFKSKYKIQLAPWFPQGYVY